MKRVHKARIVSDQAPDGLTEKVIKVDDVAVPLGLVFGEFGSLTDDEIRALWNAIIDEAYARDLEPDEEIQAVIDVD